MTYPEIEFKDTNWLRYRRLYLATEQFDTQGTNSMFMEVQPQEFSSIISTHSSQIEKHVRKTHNHDVKTVDPFSGYVKYPWLNALKLTSFEESFTRGLTPDAVEITATADRRPNLEYTYEQIQEQLQPYLDALHDTQYVWRVPKRYPLGYVAASGLWLQIKHKKHSEEDEWSSSTRLVS